MYPQLSFDPAASYTWQARGDFAIHLTLKVVAQLSAHIARVANQNETGELRGVLLGRTVEAPFRATIIEDFELVSPPESANADLDSDTLFDAACRVAKQSDHRVIGFFISGRDGRMSLRQREAETLARVFGEDGNVALLVQTSGRGIQSDAAFFYWQDGDVHPGDFGFGFPFDAAQLLDGHAGWRYPDPIEAEEQSGGRAPAVNIDSAAGEDGDLPNRTPWAGVLVTASLVVICLLALQLAAYSN